MIINFLAIQKEVIVKNVVETGNVWGVKIDKIQKELKFKRFAVKFKYQNSKQFFGRFGGGWNWKLGFQLGGNTLILNLLICSIRINLLKNIKR